MTAKLVPENVIVSDATVLINFLETNSLGILIKTFSGRLHITDVVRGEIKHHHGELTKAIEAKQIMVHEVTIDEVKHLEKSYSNLHAGEASCIELAREKSWRVATDDGTAKGIIAKVLNPSYVVTTFDILLEAVRLGLMKKGEVQPLLTKMEQQASFIYNEDEHKRFQVQLRSY